MSQPGSFHCDMAPLITRLKAMHFDQLQRAMKAAMTDGGDILRAAAARELAANRETSTLESSLAVRVKTYENVAVAIIGPKSWFSGTDTGGRTRIAHKYAHLVHDGFITRNGRRVPGNPFLRRSAETDGPKAQAAVAARLARFAQNTWSGP